MDQAKTEAQRQAMRLLFARTEFARPYFLPPDVPAERVQALRRAFDATMKDPAFLAEAEKLQIEISADDRRSAAGAGGRARQDAAGDRRARAQPRSTRRRSEMNSMHARFVLLLTVIDRRRCLSAVAQKEWPWKPVRVIVPFGAGGAADVTARLFAEHLGQAFGQQFVVENRSGGGGLIGAQAIARAEPDGYTVGSGGMSSHVLAAALSRQSGLRSGEGFHPRRLPWRRAEPDRRPSVIWA